MNLEWKDILILAIGMVLSIAAGLIGAGMQRFVDRRRERQPLNQLLNFGPDLLLFIFPHRDASTTAILPRTATEDFLAMNNFISALISMGWTKKIGIRDTRRVVESDKRRNLVIICAAKSNSVAAEFQLAIREKYRNMFVFGWEGDRVYIEDGDGAHYHSPSYEQIEKYQQAGSPGQDLSGKQFEDYAVITKAPNPWNHVNKVVWLAGIRGIGTWGAAECIKKGWRQIHDQLPRDKKDHDFSALMKVRYDNCDITSVEVRRVEVLG